MEFIGEKCSLCGKKFGSRKPKDATEVKPFAVSEKRLVSVVAPCPFCGEKIPVSGGIPVVGAEPEPETEEAESEPKAS